MAAVNVNRGLPAGRHATHPHPALTIPKTTSDATSLTDTRSPGEALNRVRQNLFARELKKFVKARTRRVAVLLVSWDEKSSGSLKTDAEINELSTVFEQSYQFRVYTKFLSCHAADLPHYQLQSALNEFFKEHDKLGTLCLVYYGGHAGRDKKQEELILRAGNEILNVPEKENVYWSKIEPTLQRLNADLLLILDCCYAGIIERNTRVWQTQGHFEFIGSTTWDTTARGPASPGSFTRHLIKALHEFSEDDITFFTTASLVQKIKSYKHFRIGAKGSICFSTCGRTNVFRHLNIMPLPRGHMHAPSPIDEPGPEPHNFYLHLKWVFTRPPSEADIRVLVGRINELIKNDGLPVSTILWEGLSKYNPRMHMADAAERLLATFSRRSSTASLKRFQSSDDSVHPVPARPRKLSRSLTTLSNELDTTSSRQSQQIFSFDTAIKTFSRSLTTLSTENGFMMSKQISHQRGPEDDPDVAVDPLSKTPLRRVPTIQFSSRRARTLQLRFFLMFCLMSLFAASFYLEPAFVNHVTARWMEIRSGLTHDIGSFVNDHLRGRLPKPWRGIGGEL